MRAPIELSLSKLGDSSLSYSQNYLCSFPESNIFYSHSDT